MPTNSNAAPKIIANYPAKGRGGVKEFTLTAGDDSRLTNLEYNTIMNFLKITTPGTRNAGPSRSTKTIDMLVLCTDDRRHTRARGQPPMFMIKGMIRMSPAVHLGGTAVRPVVKFLTPNEKIRLLKLMYPDAVVNNQVVNRSNASLLAAFAYSPVHNKLICMREDCLRNHAVTGAVPPRAFRKSADAVGVIGQMRTIPNATVVPLAAPGEGTVSPGTGKPVGLKKKGIDLSKTLKDTLFGKLVQVTRNGIVPSPVSVSR